MSSSPLAQRIALAVRNIPDFPQPGIDFKDITPVLADAALFADVVAALADPFRSASIDTVIGIESRGFIFGAPVALQLDCGFAPVRKPGKLPYHTVRVEYQLEYGTDSLEAHVDALAAGERVLIVDDVLATGGTAAATAKLAQQLGAEVVACAFVVELGFLGGRARLGKLKADALLTY